MKKKDEGFTLVELLIVIVILGILATVVVFAVQGITDKGEENACAVGKRTIETAAEAYYAAYGTAAPSVDALVDSGLLREDSGEDSWQLNASGEVVPSGTACS